MQSIKNLEELKEAIMLMEVSQLKQREELKEHLHRLQESFSPLNLIKSSINEFTSSTDLSSNLVNAGIGLATGFIGKKLFIGGSHNPIKKVIGTLIELGVAGIVAKHPEGIKSTGLSLLKKAWNGIKSKF